MKRMVGIVSVCVILAAVLAVPPVCAEDGVKVNINKATVEELVQLKGVGQKYAEAIVQYRIENGPFQTPEEIQQVPGIGARTFEVNVDRISVE